MTKKPFSLNLFIILITCLFTATILGGCVPSQTQPTWKSSQTAPPSDIETQSLDQQNTPLTSPSKFKNLPPVKVAALLPLSGTHASLGQSMLKAAQLALFDLGYDNFNLIPRDTKGTAQGAANATTAAINDGAQLIIGPLLSSSVQAAQHIAEQRNVNIIAFSTDEKLANSHTFIMGFTPRAQVERITNYSLSHGIKNFALIAPKDKYGDLVARHFQTTLQQGGGVISHQIHFTPNDPGIINQIATLKDRDQNQNFDAVFMPVGGTLTDMISSALSYNHLMPQNIKRLGTGLWDDPTIIRQSNMEGAWFAAPSPRTRAKFERDYQEIYGATPARLATLAYDATALAAILAERGYRQSGGLNPAYDTASITDPRGFRGINGVFRFNRNGIVERGLAVLEIRNGTLVEIDPAPTRF